MLETCRVWHSQLTRIVHPMLLWNRPPHFTKFMKRFIVTSPMRFYLPSDTQEIHITYEPRHDDDDEYDFSSFANLRVLQYLNDTVGFQDVLNARLETLHIYAPTYWLDTNPFTQFQGSVLCMDQWSRPSDILSALTSLRVIVILSERGGSVLCPSWPTQLPDSFLPPNLTLLHVPDPSKLGPRGQSRGSALAMRCNTFIRAYFECIRKSIFEKVDIFSFTLNEAKVRKSSRVQCRHSLDTCSAFTRRERASHARNVSRLALAIHANRASDVAVEPTAACHEVYEAIRD